MINLGKYKNSYGNTCEVTRVTNSVVYYTLGPNVNIAVPLSQFKGWEALKYTCPVCYYSLDEPPMDYNICPSCGCEFGNDDDDYNDLRDKWIKNGFKWWFQKPPENLSDNRQLDYIDKTCWFCGYSLDVGSKLIVEGAHSCIRCSQADDSTRKMLLDRITSIRNKNIDIKEIYA